MGYITASEIGRYLFCARALMYDRVFAAPRTKPFWRRWLQSLGWQIMLISAISLALYLSLGWDVMLITLGVSMGLLIVSQVLWRRLRRGADVVIIYRGTRAIRNQTMFTAEPFGLSGKPSYLLEAEGTYIPVLVKQNDAPSSPHEAHVMQVIAYCLLTAEAKQHHPPYGVIRYGDGRTFEIDFDEDAVEILSSVMDEIETDRQAKDVPRSHNERRRCYACSQRQRCDQSLF